MQELIATQYSVVYGGDIKNRMNIHGVQVASHARILATVEDYIHGWYSGNPARTTRCLHPQLAKRLVRDDATIEELDAATLIGYVHGRVGTAPPATQQQEIEILGVYGNTASVRGFLEPARSTMKGRGLPAYGPNPREHQC